MQQLQDLKFMIWLIYLNLLTKISECKTYFKRFAHQWYVQTLAGIKTSDNTDFRCGTAGF